MYIAVDPGETCGLFIVSNEGKICGAMEAPPFETVTRVENLLRDMTGCTIVSERFDLVRQSIAVTRQVAALETIGALRFIAQKFRARFLLSGRANKARVGNDTLRHVGWYNVTRDGHVNDAARHCLIIFAKENPTSDLVKTLAVKMS